jgi:2'-5' RNA ligase
VSEQRRPKGFEQLVLGVAIAIPPPHATVLTGWRRRAGDPQADLIWPHVTLLPPTPLAISDLEEIDAHLAEAARVSEPFVMHLSGTGTFRPISPVVFIQVARGVADCELLEKTIRMPPLDRDLDFPYHPHVTVAHGVADAALDLIYDGLAGFVGRFTVDRFASYVRAASGGWQIRREYVLGG